MSPLSSPASPQNPPNAGARSAVRHFGRYQLLQLLGKSQRSMGWLVNDTLSGSDCMLLMPRHQPDAAEAVRWREAVDKAGRLNHPKLLKAIDVGEHERWPYVAYERGGWATWAEHFSYRGLPAEDLASWAAQAAQGLAFAHEAGLAHRDIQPWNLLVDEHQHAAVMGLEVALHMLPAAQAGGMDELRANRNAAEGDVLSLGLVLHHGLVGSPPLEDADTGAVIQRMPPHGPEFVRLPWAVPRPLPDPLRAIVNRATDRQERQRYRNARTLQRALEGWLRTQSEHEGGPLGLLLERLRAIGALPAQAGAAERLARMAMMDRCRTGEVAELVLSDIGLTFELLRVANQAQQGERGAGDGPVLMVRRAVAMLGMEGVRRAALALRPWPGPMNEAAARDMLTLMRRIQRTEAVAVSLAPAGYDPEVVRLVVLLQCLGRLLVQYHFPEEAAQIRRLMMPGEGPEGEPGMGGEAASFAVLGVDLDELGCAVVQHWGLDESVLQMMRRPGAQAIIHAPAGDSDTLRLTSACAIALVDALSLPAPKVGQALRQIAQRFARPLGLDGKALQEALQASAHVAAAGAPVEPGGGPAPNAAGAAGVGMLG